MSEFDMPSSPSIKSELMLSDPTEGLGQESKVVPGERKPKLNAHERYHIQDKNVVFVIRDTEFKIHTHFLTRESKRFQDMVAQAPPNGRVSVPNVAVDEFENLLDFFYEGMYEDFYCTLDQWISILRVSTLYELPQVRERAIREVNAERHELKLDPVRKIELAQEHNVPEWMSRAYEALCQRERGLDDSEATRLGVVTTNRLWAAREAVRRKVNGNVTGSVNGFGAFGRPPPNPPNVNVWKEQRYDTSTVTQTVSEIFCPPQPQPEPDPPMHKSEPYDSLPTWRNATASGGKKKKKKVNAARDLPHVVW